ncbi:MAG: dUTP diphosphatase [Phycisphaerales bacterium]|jgi:dUTP pyrophosphatase|nr:dUTP diphosphatase [Phycisphaerales bacterium]
MQPYLRIKRLNPRATTPRYQSDGAAGLDVSACLPEGTESIVLEPGRIAIIPAGFAMAIPTGFEAQVRPRSGLSSKHGICLPNAPGTIDCDYRGEVMIPLINHGREPFAVTHGMRIAQLVIAPVSHALVSEVDELDGTARGAGGFGSTGTH